MSEDQEFIHETEESEEQKPITLNDMLQGELHRHMQVALEYKKKIAEAKTDHKKKYYQKKLVKNNKEALQVLTAIERVRKGIDLRENEKVERDTHETEYHNEETKLEE